MKIATFAFILFAFFASIVDSVACLGHEFSQTNKTVIVNTISSISQNNLSDFPLDHCGVCSHYCIGKLTFIVDYRNPIKFSFSLHLNNNFIHSSLKLKTILDNSERPPAIS